MVGAGEFLEDFRPAFLDWPKHRKIWENLPQTSAPVKSVGPVELP